MLDVLSVECVGACVEHVEVVDKPVGCVECVGKRAQNNNSQKPPKKPIICSIETLIKVKYL